MNVKNLIQVTASSSSAHEFAVLGRPNLSGRVHVPSAERKADAEAVVDVLAQNLPLETFAFLALEVASRYAACPEMREAMARASTHKLLPWEAEEACP